MKTTARQTASPPEIFASTLKLLEELTAISSPSGDTAGLRAAAERLGDAYRRSGLEVEIRSRPDDSETPQPVLYARGPAAGDSRAATGYLLVVGHLDTVLAAAPPELRDDRLVATGATDMKGGLVALAGALELLAAAGDRAAAADLLIAVVPDEEVGGRLTKEVVETLGAGARGLWVLEPGRTEGDAETMVIGRRGMFQWQLEVAGRAAHAGNGYWQGRSALVAAADWCLRTRALASPGPGPTVNAGRLVAGESSFVEDLAGGASLIGTARQLNVVPDRARAEGEARFRQAGEGEALRREMAALAERVAGEHGVEAAFSHSDPVRPIAASEASRRWAREAMAAAERHGWQLRVEDDRPGISFPNFLPAGVDIPAIDGLGPVGGGMHTRDEYVELRSLDRRIVLLAELLRAVRER
ncbi:MAG: M20/M25/M40 family metallo-hydrolase [Thermoanaerobaculia bacterium]